MHEISGTALWPAVRALLVWGDEYYAPARPWRVFQHAADEAPLDELGRCTACGAAPTPLTRPCHYDRIQRFHLTSPRRAPPNPLGSVSSGVSVLPSAAARSERASLARASSPPREREAGNCRSGVQCRDARESLHANRVWSSNW
jgi:hypothetical protein